MNFCPKRTMECWNHRNKRKLSKIPNLRCLNIQLFRKFPIPYYLPKFGISILRFVFNVSVHSPVSFNRSFPTTSCAVKYLPSQFPVHSWRTGANGKERSGTQRYAKTMQKKQTNKQEMKQMQGVQSSYFVNLIYACLNFH